MTTVLEVRELTASVGSRTLFKDVSLSLSSGESCAVRGPSGSGKTTLLNCVLGLRRPDAGSVTVCGADMVRVGASERAKLRREQIGVVFQAGELLPELSPLDNVMVSALLNGARTKVAEGRARGLLDELGLRAEGRPVGDFSGGEQQRVAVARALVNRPTLLVADEPTGSLDPDTRDIVADLVFDLPDRFGCALLVVTHDPDVSGRASQTLVLGAAAPSRDARAS